MTLSFNSALLTVCHVPHMPCLATQRENEKNPRDMAIEAKELLKLVKSLAEQSVYKNQLPKPLAVGIHRKDRRIHRVCSEIWMSMRHTMGHFRWGWSQSVPHA